METIKIKTEKVTKEEQELEVKLPHYSKTATEYYCILAYKQTIRVNRVDGLFMSISVSDLTNVMTEAACYPEATKEEFEHAYQMADLAIRAMVYGTAKDLSSTESQYLAGIEPDTNKF